MLSIEVLTGIPHPPQFQFASSLSVLVPILSSIISHCSHVYSRNELLCCVLKYLAQTQLWQLQLFCRHEYSQTVSHGRIQYEWRVRPRQKPVFHWMVWLYKFHFILDSMFIKILRETVFTIKNWKFRNSELFFSVVFHLIFR